MLNSRQRIAVYILAALSVTMLLHVHATLDSASNHCAICVQHSHGIVEHANVVCADEQVVYFESATGEPGLLPALQRETSPRAPPA